MTVTVRQAPFLYMRVTVRSSTVQENYSQVGAPFLYNSYSLRGSQRKVGSLSLQNSQSRGGALSLHDSQKVRKEPFLYMTIKVVWTPLHIGNLTVMFDMLCRSLIHRKSIKNGSTICGVRDPNII